jgi:hypothetical protein
LRREERFSAAGACRVGSRESGVRSRRNIDCDG